MTGILSKALSVVFKENEVLVVCARNLGEAAAMRIHRKERCTDLARNRDRYRWQIEFDTEAEMSAFHNALAEIIDEVTGVSRDK